MVRGNFARGLTWLALFSGYTLTLAAQDVATCKGPAELEQTIKAHPSAGAYDALGAYFGQRQKISCAISAFESAVHLDPNSWEAHFNLALALLQTNPRGPLASFESRPTFNPTILQAISR